MSEFTFVRTAPEDRESVAVEVVLDGEGICEVFREEGDVKVEFYPTSFGQYPKLSARALMDAIEEAIRIVGEYGTPDL